MEHWNTFKEITNTFLDNIDMIDVMPISTSTKHQRIIERVEHYSFHSCHKDGAEIGTYIHKARNEISAYLINVNTADRLAKKVKVDFENMLVRLRAVDEKWELNHAKNLNKFGNYYFPHTQLIYDFYDWFLNEGKPFEEVSESPKKLKKEIDPYFQLRRVRSAVSQISAGNAQVVYQKNFNRFLYLNSDEVTVNDEVVNDKLERQMLMFPKENGESNIQTFWVSGLKEGFPLTEMDFIEFEKGYIELKGIDKYKLKKQVQTYLDYLNLRGAELQNTRVTGESQTSLSFQESPFVEHSHFDAFMYLQANFNVKEKIRWTYIYELLTDKMKIGVSQAKFFTYINDNFEKVAKRKNENANDSASIGALNKIYSEMKSKPNQV